MTLSVFHPQATDASYAGTPVTTTLARQTSSDYTPIEPPLPPFISPQRLTSPPPDFKERFRQECVEGSGIDPKLFAAAVEFTEDEHGGEIHALLGWNYPRFWQFRKPHNFGGCFAGFMQEDGSLWQGKPAEMPPTMDAKYLAPKEGARAFLPSVSVGVWVEIARIHGLVEELPTWVKQAHVNQLDGLNSGPGAFDNCAHRLGTHWHNETESFWEWIEHHPSIPLILTEGAKKALCGLSHGYVMIAGFGVDAFSRKGEGKLLPELLRFIHPSRQWCIAFDEDEKRTTRRRVRAATARTAQLLVAAGSSVNLVSILQWDATLGKGLDDVVVLSGVEAFHQIVRDAVTLKAWKRGGFEAYLRFQYPELFGLTHTPELVLNSRFLPQLNLPEAGGILAISSPMGTGKTEAMKALIAQARQRDPDCLVELIGYRNSLGLQSAQRLGLSHIHDLQGSPLAQTFIASTPTLAYCLDSLHRRFDIVEKALAAGRKVLVLLDEVDAVLKHLLLGSTLGARRGEIALMFCRLLAAVVRSGGWIVAGEADLHSMPISFLESVTETPATVVLNQWQGSPWRVTFPMPTSLKGAPAPSLMDKAALDQILYHLKQGQRVAVPTDSKDWGERLERLAMAEGVHVLRLDGETSEQPWAQALMKDPDAYLERVKPNLFIYTPTAESGLSITGHHFDIMVCYGSHLEHRALLQLMGRIRTTLPRTLFAREAALFDQSGRMSDPKTLLEDWILKARYSLKTTQQNSAIAPVLAQVNPQPDGTAALLHQFAALYQARCNLSCSHLRHALMNHLKTHGHLIDEQQTPALTDEFRLQLQDIQETLSTERALAYAQTDTSDITVEKAHRILQSSASKQQDRLKAHKRLLQSAYPGLPLDDNAFVERCIVKTRAKKLRQHTALFLAHHPEIARLIDHDAWQAQLQRPLLWLPDIKAEAAKAILIEQSGLLQLFELDEYAEDSPAVQRVRVFSLLYQQDIQRMLGIWCDDTHTGIQMVNKLARKLGMTPRVVRKQGPRGTQERIWGWSDQDDDDRDEVFRALTHRWASLLEPQKLPAPVPKTTVVLTLDKEIFFPQNETTRNSSAPFTPDFGSIPHDPVQTTALICPLLFK